MKIGIYSPYLNTLGGGERYMLSIAEYLSQEHFVDIFWDDKMLKEKARARFAIDISRTNIVEDIFAHNKSFITKAKKTQKYDVLFFLSDGSIPLSLAKHTVLHFQRPFPTINGNNVFTKIKLKGKTTFVCNSKFTKKWIDRSFGISSRVLYPPVSVEHFSPKEKKKIIFSVGRFHAFKKQDVLINAFQKNAKVFKDWKLILAGGLMDQDKKYFDSLEKLIKLEQVILKPNISYDRLVEHYAISSLYWHAAGYDENERTNPEAMEHFGITTIEAMASGSIVLAYDGGGQQEIIEDGVNGYLWKTQKELVTKSKNIINKGNSNESVISNGIKSSTLYTRLNFNKELDKIISI